jgi:hypothetical protein
MTLTLEAQSAPKADLWERWLQHNAQNENNIDHKPWNLFLKKYLIEDSSQLNRVAYRRVTSEDKMALKQYIKLTSSLPISDFNQAQQRAFWINLYNALTIDIVLDHYPVKSILNIKLSSGFFTRGPWKKKIVNVESEALSLDDIEHRLLRPIWQDPRIHYAVNCASLGCPNLSSQAFTAENTEALLDNAAISFINHSRGVNIENGKLTVSSIYEWFQEDFGGNDKGVIQHLTLYAKPELKKHLATINKIHNDQYDWQLNDGE